jgi:hypothetical protein
VTDEGAAGAKLGSAELSDGIRGGCQEGGGVPLLTAAALADRIVALVREEIARNGGH